MRVRYFLQDEAGAGDAGKGGAAGAVAGAGGAGAGTATGATSGAAGGQGAGAGAAGVITEWPADWRQRIAGEDKESLKTLERFTEPAAMFKSYSELRTKMAKGELKAVSQFPEKGTPEEQTAWRKEQGIPEKPEGYDLNLGDGLIIGDDDKPWVDMFLAKAHAANLPQGAVKTTLSSFFGEIREKQNEKAAEADREVLQRAEDQLRKEWGADYRPNMSAITGLLDAHVSAESGLKARVMASIQREPEFAKLWATLARQINPVSTLVGIDPARMDQSINDEIGKIENTMKTNRAAYNKDEKMQARLRELYAARDKLKGR